MDKNIKFGVSHNGASAAGGSALGNGKKGKTVCFRSAEGSRAYRFNGAPQERCVLPGGMYTLLGEYTGWTAG